MKSIFLILSLLTLSCTTVEYGNSALPELTPIQEAAFDALTRLQVTTDEKNRFYSTFPDIPQPCYPADTSFVISQTELLVVMNQFISTNCKRLSKGRQKELAETSVLAQDSFKVLHCRDRMFDPNQKEGFPMNGTWVMPDVLGRRDVVIVW